MVNRAAEVRAVAQAFSLGVDPRLLVAFTLDIDRRDERHDRRLDSPIRALGPFQHVEKALGRGAQRADAIVREHGPGVVENQRHLQRVGGLVCRRADLDVLGDAEQGRKVENDLSARPRFGADVIQPLIHGQGTLHVLQRSVLKQSGLKVAIEQILPGACLL